MDLILEPNDHLEKFKQFGGGKAANLARLTSFGFTVPTWICLTSEAYKEFIIRHGLEDKLSLGEGNLAEFSQNIERLFLDLDLPGSIKTQVEEALNLSGLQDAFVAVRSSGIDEDSAEHSFAGQFSSFLYQKGLDAVLKSIKLCWASGFSERGLSYRLKNGLQVNDIQVGVVIQRMVDADVSGVAFSRNPVDPLDRSHVMISSVWGLGEGLVSGELDADHFLFDRHASTIESHLVKKNYALRQGPHGGLTKVSVNESQPDKASLSDFQIERVARLALELEEQLGSPQDCEWAFSGNTLYCLQSRPITNLPPEAFYDKQINGSEALLWDNSNIIESYSGVTSPLTFSFASYAYQQVYLQFCQVIAVPGNIISEYDSVFRNMLGLIRGRIYYNLINWYKLVVLLPGASNNTSFMETMMGVKQALSPEVAALFDFVDKPQQLTLMRKAKLYAVSISRFLRIDSIVETFQTHFNRVYEKARKTDFKTLSLQELLEYYLQLDKSLLQKWQAPIINDCICMVFFGLLKKMTQKWVSMEQEGSSLQNDLLCGQGDLESTEPTKMLMRIAEVVDHGDPQFRDWFLNTPSQKVWEMIANHQKSAQIHMMLREFLERYGFRCINELKLEENDLHDDPAFVINAIASYVKMKAYSVEEMAEREKAIRYQAEAKVLSKLKGPRKILYLWVLKHARKAIRHRENMRFARTKIFGIVRHLFRAIGSHFEKLGVLSNSRDIFYLTVDEIFAFIEGRSISANLKALAEIRNKEFEGYKNSPPPPDRFVTYGAVGSSLQYPQVLMKGDLNAGTKQESEDPSILIGTPCCPGFVEGVVRVVKDMKDAEGLHGEILVAERTDPGWVPLYPSCSGLLIERGSLLSHSAVVARELGLPTIVGISGGLMQKLKTGSVVRVDASKGEVKIISH